MQKMGSWAVLQVDPETYLGRMRRLEIPANSAGIRVCLRGVFDFEARKERLQRQFLSVLAEVVDQERKESHPETEGSVQGTGAYRSFSASSFASQVSHWLCENTKMNQLRIETSKSESEMLISLAKQGPDTKGFRLNFPDPKICDALEILSPAPSGLVKLTLHLKQLKISEAAAMANFLSRHSKEHSSALKEVRIEGVDRFATENGDPLSESDTYLRKKESAVLLGISSLIANSLETNQNLRSFHLTGSQRATTQSSSEKSCRIFAKMMETNLSLEGFQFLSVTSGNDDASKTVQMFLKLNRHGQRKRLLAANHNADKLVWVEAIAKYNSYDQESVYYLLRNNPSLCQ